MRKKVQYCLTVIISVTNDDDEQKICFIFCFISLKHNLENENLFYYVHTRVFVRLFFCLNYFFTCARFEINIKLFWSCDIMNTSLKVYF